MIGQVFDCIYNFVYFGLMISFYRSFCEKKVIDNRVRIILIYTAWFVLYNALTIVLTDYLFAKLIVTFILHLIGLSRIYKSKIIKAILLLLSLFGIGICADFLMFNLQRKLFPGVTNLDSIFISVSSILMGSLSLLTQLIIVLIIKRIASNSHYDELNTTEMVKYSVFPLFSILLVVLLCLQSENVNTETQITLTIVSVSLLLLMNIYVFFFLRNEINHKLATSRQSLLINHAFELTEMYNQSCLEREDQAKKNHEYKNIISAIEKLLNDEKYDEAAKYCRSQISNYAQAANIVNTGNPIINAVFNTKYAEAIRKDIIVRFNINDLTEVNLEYADIITILSNLLNNAIEACEKCEISNRIIDVVIRVINDSELMISIKNTYNEPLKKVGSDLYATTKLDSYNHGYGLRNIKSVVSRLNGFMELENDSDFFKATVVIKCK